MDRKAVIKGSLQFISLADIFQIFGTNNSTGLLNLTSPYNPDEGLIYFSDGNPINAVCGALKGIKALYAFFGWTEGEFEFYKEDVNTERLVKQGRMEIILDALRMLDDGLIERVGPQALDKALTQRSGGKEDLPVTKGPLTDFSFVIEEETYREGDKIVNEGRYGKWMWVISEGTVRITKKTKDDSLTIARLGAGCFIGTVKTLMYGEYEWNYTATAENDVKLWLLDPNRLYREYELLSPEFRLLLSSLDNRLNGISDRAVELFEKEDKINSLPEDQKIFIEKGSSQEELYTIVKGEAVLMVESQKKSIPLLVLKKRDTFGHIPFMDIGHEPRSASVVGLNDLQIEQIDAQQIKDEYNKLSSKLKGMIYNMGTCISITTSLAMHLHKLK
jgi:CRP-like cAMP-binding protein